MSIAVIVAAAVAAAAPAAPVNPSLPPIVVNLAATSDVSPRVIKMAVEEVETLFRSAGIRFIWRRGDHLPGALRVVIGAEPGPALDRNTPLGWLEFDNGVPSRDIHISYRNTERFMEASREVVRLINQKTIVEHDLLLGRALGRALAHELGHYLLAAKEHTAKGLLKGARTAQEFFSPDRSPFALNAVERRQIAARLRKELNLARRNN